MAVGSIAASVTLSLTSTNVLENWMTGALSLNQAGSRMSKSVMNVPAAMTAIPLSGLGTGTVGYIMIQSLETAAGNIMYLATTTAVTTSAAVLQLGAGEVALFKVGPGMQAPAISAVTAGQARLLVFEL